MVTLRKGDKRSEVRLVQQILGLYVDGIFGELTDEGVRAFQKAQGLEVDGIVGKNTWAALQKEQADQSAQPTESQPLGISLTKSRRKITEIIVHCSATPEGKDYTVADIKRWHLQRGFSDIGYHYVIYRNGSVRVGRDANISGAHTVGHNYNSIGICYIGGLAIDGKTAKDTRTPAQKTSMLALLKTLRKLYPKATIHGHREFANKACPCFDAKSEYKDI